MPVLLSLGPPPQTTLVMPFLICDNVKTPLKGHFSWQSVLGQRRGYIQVIKEDIYKMHFLKYYPKFTLLSIRTMVLKHWVGTLTWVAKAFSWVTKECSVQE